MEPKWRQNGAKIGSNRGEIQGKPRGNIQGKLGKNVRNTWGKSKENLGEIQEIHIKPKENPGSHPGKMQGQSRENLRELQGNSKEARGTSPRKIQRKQGRPPGKRVASVARERAQRASERSKWSSNRFKQTGSKIDFNLIWDAWSDRHRAKRAAFLNERREQHTTNNEPRTTNNKQRTTNTMQAHRAIALSVPVLAQV